MVVTITQQTFDDTVRENMEEFEMNTEDAIRETLEQFKAQGIDITHIVTDWMLSGSTTSPALTGAITTLSNLVKSKEAKEREEYINVLDQIKKECEKGLQYQVLAGKEGAYNVILDTLLKAHSDKEITKACLQTLIALMKKQPDLLDEHGIRTIIRFIDRQKDLEVLSLLLKWVKECCVMHEKNRQNIFDAAILDHLKPLLNDANSVLLKDVLAVLRALVLDDDVRVEFGRAHEHARTIASDTLCAITSLLKESKQDETLIIELMLTISSLLVRTEFCKKVEDAGCLDIIRSAMAEFHESDKLNNQCLKLLKALAGNDECKAHIIKKGGAKMIVSAISRHQESLQTAINGLGCVAALTLRCPDNSKALFEAGIPAVIIEIMTLHPDNENVQKNASWAIRNMVSRSRYQNKKFLELGVEGLLLQGLKQFKKSEYDIKAALRDLGCDVELKEEWTGKGGRLHTDAKK